MLRAISIILFPIWTSLLLGACAPASSPPPAIPPLPLERVPAPPPSTVTLIWQPGHYEWDAGRYRWERGRWVPRTKGSLWQDGLWVRTPTGWRWEPAHWL